MAGPAHAQEVESATRAGEPAATPTGEDARARAERLFVEGNLMLEKYRLVRAVEKYRLALEHWDHPAIHFNLAKALHGLDRPLEAYRHAELALQGGAEWLGAGEQGQKNHERILALRNELRSELAGLTVTSAVHGVQIAVDSEPIALGSPAEQMVLPGTHRMAAQKRGHHTLSKPFTVSPGESVAVALSSHRPMAPWKPWAATGGGLALGIVGAFLSVQAVNRRDELERRAVEDCRSMECRDTAFADDWSSVELRWRVGLGSIVVGAGVATVGGYFLVRNWQRELRMSLVRRGAVSLTPTISPALTGMTAVITF